MDTTVLGDALLDGIRSRAAAHDRDNTFPHEDLAALREAGYLAALVPRDLGGLGLDLETVAREHRRLAGAAPATALAVTMPLVWTAVARELLRRGDRTLEWVLRDAAAGEVFGFGLSEAGNDLVLLGSTTEAVPQPDGSYRFEGTKVFTTLSPVWTRLGVLGLDTTSADAPRIVHAFLHREDGGTRSLGDWDSLGMRATQSHTTLLEGALARPGRITRRLPPGPSADPLVFAIFAAFEILIACVYTGIARRALDLAVEAAHRRSSLRTGLPLAADPLVRRRVAAAAVEWDALPPQIDALAHDVDAGVDHGYFWQARLAGLKLRATESARRVVGEAALVAGGTAYRSSSELSRLWRDVQAGAFHPSEADSAHATVAAAWLGPVPTGAEEG